MAEAKKKVEATKPTPEEKQAAAEAEVDALVARAKKALVEFENLDQKQVDRIVAKASIAALNKHLVLAKMAVDETGRGGKAGIVLNGSPLFNGGAGSGPAPGCAESHRVGARTRTAD